MAALQKLTDEDLADIRSMLAGRLSPKRFQHTIGVENTAVRMGRWLSPEKIPVLRLAALFHDLTKELSPAEQLRLCDEVYRIPLTDTERCSTQALHARTGAYVARDLFPDLCTDEVFSAIYKHTTGDAVMSLTDKIIYLADVIEDNRTYPACVALRRRFFDGIREDMPLAERERHLNRVVFASLNSTVQSLKSRGEPVIESTLYACESIQKEL